MNNVFWTIEDPEHFAWYGYLTPWDEQFQTLDRLAVRRTNYLKIFKAKEPQSIINNSVYLVGDNYG